MNLEESILKDSYYLLELWKDANNENNFNTALLETKKALNNKIEIIPIYAPLKVFDKKQINFIVIKPYYNDIFPKNFYSVEISTNIGFGSYYQLNHQVLNLSENFKNQNREFEIFFEFIPTWKKRIKFLSTHINTLFDESVINKRTIDNDNIFKTIYSHENGHINGILPLKNNIDIKSKFISALYDLSADLSFIEIQSEEVILMTFTYHLYNLYNFYIRNKKDINILNQFVENDPDAINSFIIFNILDVKLSGKSLKLNYNVILETFIIIKNIMIKNKENIISNDFSCFHQYTKKLNSRVFNFLEKI